MKKKKHFVARKKKIVPFLSSSLTKEPAAKIERIPGPMDYHPRFGVKIALFRLKSN